MVNAGGHCYRKFLFLVTAVIFYFVRFVVVCGDGEYIIYTAMALRNKSFGSAQEFVWASDSSEYVLIDCQSVVHYFYMLNK